MSQQQPGPSLRVLRAMSDAEVIARHDERTEYFTYDVAVRAVCVQELDRRAAERAARAANRLAVITAVVSVLALGVAVVALVKP